ncbi:hypothetical protein B0T25DRAFT_571760 [Lasiosphaeria hispida]|uniref:Ankyrin n=1 Tax=Lasiosphaeria hispida TaxID=260671 RepID=A0AAJ0MB02_9PEZI|nr:hypothetical protein B0T25DRAFT_571760 [Lasiosphaeria hispida]
MPEQALTPLHIAARDGDNAMITALLDEGAEIGALACPAGHAPLHLAVCSGHLSSAELLISRGAPKATMHVERDGAAPLSAMHTAAWQGDLAMCKMLVRRGGFKADVDVYDLHFLGGAEAAVQWYNTHRQTLQEWPDQVPMALQPVPLGFRVDAAFHLTVGQGLPKSSEGLPEIGKCLSEGTEAIAKFLEAINMAISMSWGRMINRSELADETEKNLSQAGWAHLALNPFALAAATNSSRPVMWQDGEEEKEEVMALLKFSLQGFKGSAKGDWEAVLEAWELRGNRLLAEAKAWGKVNRSTLSLC